MDRRLRDVMATAAEWAASGKPSRRTAGRYPNPDGIDSQRWWNGEAWSDGPPA